MRTVASLIPAALAIVTAHAQTGTAPIVAPPPLAGFYFEARAGVNRTELDGNPVVREQFSGEMTSEGYESARGWGARIATTIGYQFRPFVGIEIDMAYDGKSVANGVTTQNRCGENGPLVDAERSYEIAVDYVSLGLLARLSLGPFFVFGGPTASLPVSESIEERIRLDEDCVYFLGTPDQTSELRGELRNTDAGLRGALSAGIGFVLDLGPSLDIVARAAYDHALGGTFEGPGWYEFRRPGSISGRHFVANINDGMRLSSIHATLGVRLALSKALKRTDTE